MEKGIIVKINSRGEEKFFALSDIVCIITYKNYTDFICANGGREKSIRITIIKAMSLINEQGSFAEHGLFKFGRNVIVNTHYQQGEIKMKSNPLIPVMGIGDKLLDPDMPRIKLCFGDGNEIIAEGTVTGARKLIKLERKRPPLIANEGGNQCLSCELEQLHRNEPEENGFKYVDLGLPSGIMWATSNMPCHKTDSFKDETYGQYYGWGEPFSKFNYDREHRLFQWGEELPLRLKGSKDNYDWSSSNQIPDVRDLAYTEISEHWHIPTKDEWKELIDNCEFTWCESKFKNHGLLAVSKINGKCIFLPASGYKDSSVILRHVEDKELHYWSSTNCDESKDTAYAFSYVHDGNSTSGCNPEVIESEGYKGFFIRPVRGGSVPFSNSFEKFRYKNFLCISLDAESCAIIRTGDDDSITIPKELISYSGIKYKATILYGASAHAQEMSIPETVTEIKCPYYLGFAGRMRVDEKNPTYFSKDGILFDKEQKTLLYFPRNKMADYYEIPPSVIEIGEYAFAGCRVLEINLNNVKRIRNNAFESSDITSIRGSQVEVIDNRAFRYCKYLNKAEFPQVKETGEDVFWDCESLKNN